MVQTNQRAVVTVSPSQPGDPALWPDSTIINSYANSDNLTTMEAYNVDQVALFHTTPLSNNLLYKISWTLTPDVHTVERMLLPGHPKSLIELADTASKALDPWFSGRIAPHQYSYPVLANIVIIDHFETSDIAQVVLRGL
eukprot:m.61962 g.61962  ORF g.61962 m.61962 type:complete len:140 (-) comp16235_c0_seq1:142-561(-)